MPTPHLHATAVSFETSEYTFVYNLCATEVLANNHFDTSYISHKKWTFIHQYTPSCFSNISGSVQVTFGKH